MSQKAKRPNRASHRPNRPQQDASRPLDDARRELFAQRVASGMPVKVAYEMSGYKGGRFAMHDLRRAPVVEERINWLLANRIEADTKWRHRSEKRLDDSRVRLIRELERIAYSDLRQVAVWGSRPQFDGDGNLIAVEETVRAVPSDKLSRDAAASIKGVMTKAGGVQIETHDKLAALEKLARVLGMYQNDVPPAAGTITVNQVNVAGNALEAARRVGFLVGAIAAGQADAPPLELRLGPAGEDIAAGPSAPAANG